MNTRITTMKLMDRTKTARNDARRAARDARRTIAGEPRGMGAIASLLLGLGAAAAGAIVTFLADPARGRARRARLMDRGGAVARRAVRQVEHATRSASGIAAGRLSRARFGGQGARPTDDVTLRDRAETELFRDPSVPKGDINLSVERGVLVLRGEVGDAKMKDRLGREAEAIDGVWSVHNLLHLPGEPARSEDLVGSVTG